jgi:hypothetical protein
MPLSFLDLIPFSTPVTQNLPFSPLYQTPANSPSTRESPKASQYPDSRHKFSPSHLSTKVTALKVMKVKMSMTMRMKMKIWRMVTKKWRGVTRNER